MNRVTYHIYGRIDKKNKRGELPLCLAVTVNTERLMIPLSVSVKESSFDGRRVKQSEPKSYIINEILSNAETKALEILRDANAKNVKLDRKTFRVRFSSAFSDDFVGYWRNEIEVRKDILKYQTLKGHRSQLAKFAEFRPCVPFDQISPGLIEKYEAFLIRKGNNVNSRRTALKVLQTYIHRAMNDEIPVKDPFKKYKIPAAVETRESLSMAELRALLKAYDKRELPDYLHSSLMAYLLSSFTAMRVGDVGTFGEKMIKENKLIYMPEKSNRTEKMIRISLTDISKRIIKDVLQFLKAGGKFKADQKINEDLKTIANLTSVNPALHFHMSRHTFGTTYLRIGGSLETLQRIMGHSSIRTTQIYAHMIDERIDKEMQNFNKEFQ